MSSRLDQEREKRLQPLRIKSAIDSLNELGISIHYESAKEIRFTHKEAEIKFFPYSGWHTGKSIKDGRGFKKLFDQLKEEE